MKIGIIPREDAANINNQGIGDIRWVANIYHLLTANGYDVEFVHWKNAECCDILLDIHHLDHCVQTNAKRHVHFSFWSQNFEARPNARICDDGKLTIIGTCYRRSFDTDKTRGNKLIPVFCPMPYPDDLMPNCSVPGFDRTHITWAIRRSYLHDYCKTYSNNLLRALIRLNKRADFTIDFIDYNHVQGGTSLKEGEGLINQLSCVTKHVRIPWKDVLDIQAQSKITLYHDFESGASTNETLFCKGVPLFPADNHFWYVPEGVGSPKTEQELYDALERLWFDEQLYQRHLEFYQDAFSDHRAPKVLSIWKETLEQVMDIDPRA